jgi:hypothetical protein
MSRLYAGIFGYLAMSVAICRGWLGSAGVEGTLTWAVISMVVFAVVGAILGHIAQATIDQSVQAKLELELKARGAAGG